MWKTSLLISRTKLVEILRFCGVITEQFSVIVTWLPWWCCFCLTFWRKCAIIKNVATILYGDGGAIMLNATCYSAHFNIPLVRSVDARSLAPGGAGIFSESAFECQEHFDRLLCNESDPEQKSAYRQCSAVLVCMVLSGGNLEQISYVERNGRYSIEFIVSFDSIDYLRMFLGILNVMSSWSPWHDTPGHFLAKWYDTIWYNWINKWR